MKKSMDSSSSTFPSITFENLNNHHKITRKIVSFLLWALGATSIIILFILYSLSPFSVTSKQDLNQRALIKHEQKGDDERCDIFMGRWVSDPTQPIYTNTSCRTIPESKNCGMYGKDGGFLNWRWKPDGCELPKFESVKFLRIVRGKKMAFIGDSVARNHMESLLCLLSQVETPTNIYEDSEDRFRTWYFPSHNFTLMALWSKFLVLGVEQVINGSSSGVFDIHLDQIDDKWTSKLTGIDYTIISDGHWFFRKLYLHEGNSLIGCVYCLEPNVTNFGPGFAIKRVFQTSLGFIKDYRYGAIVTIVRTFSPAHFENGSWNDGGTCNRTKPLSEEELGLRGRELEIRSGQLEEVERVREEGEKRGKRFRVLDVTKAMLLRADGHPGLHWNNKGMDGYSDCVHWCLPGPIDVWNDLLLGLLNEDSTLY